MNEDTSTNTVASTKQNKSNMPDWTAAFDWPPGAFVCLTWLEGVNKTLTCAVITPDFHKTKGKEVANKAKTNSESGRDGAKRDKQNRDRRRRQTKQNDSRGTVGQIFTLCVGWFYIQHIEICFLFTWEIKGVRATEQRLHAAHTECRAIVLYMHLSIHPSNHPPYLSIHPSIHCIHLSFIPPWMACIHLVGHVHSCIQSIIHSSIRYPSIQPSIHASVINKCIYGIYMDGWMNTIDDVYPCIYSMLTIRSCICH